MALVDTPLDCTLCPRLVAFRQDNQDAFPDYFNAPVPNFGDSDAEVMIVGLAPGLHGANATGRPFTGDWAGDLLFDTLLKTGFATGKYDKHIDDGLTLKNILICNSVKCVPPQNKPTGEEVNTCRPFLVEQINALPRLKIMINLGKIAHDSALRVMGTMMEGIAMKNYPFAHEAVHTLPNGLKMVDSYHCSRYNTNTGRLTPDMFENVFRQTKNLL